MFSSVFDHVLALIAALCPLHNQMDATNLAEYIEIYSIEFKVPPELAVAVMAHESGCSMKKRGSKGEVGAFQILPKGSASQGYSVAELKLYYINVKLGIKHIARCARRCRGKFRLGMSIYNGHKSCIESNYSKAIMKLCHL